MKKILVLALALVCAHIAVARGCGPCGPCGPGQFVGPGGIRPGCGPCGPCPGWRPGPCGPGPGWCWGRGGRNFWPGFAAGCVAGAALRTGYYGGGYCAPTVVYSGTAAYGVGITPPIVYPPATVVSTTSYVAPATTVVAPAVAPVTTVAPVATVPAAVPVAQPVYNSTTVIHERPTRPLVDVDLGIIRASVL